jgi:hypothetical protein
MPHHFFRQKGQYPQRGSPSCRHCDKYGHIKAECFRVKPHKPKKNQIYEGLVNMMKSVLVKLKNLDIAYNPAYQKNKVCDVVFCLLKYIYNKINNHSQYDETF